jgi:hypothetical protein
MKHHNLNILKQIVDLFSVIDENTSGKCHIMAESGYDEAVIVGTKQSLLSLAKMLIEIVYNYSDGEGQDNVHFEKGNEDGVSYLSTDLIKGLFDEMADVWPVCAFIADNDDDVQAIVKSFKD